VKLSDLKASQIQEFLNHLQLHGSETGGALSPKRVHAAASLLYSCRSDAVRLEHLALNPMADRRVKLPKRAVLPSSISV
jgi:hypothetical protein